MSDIDLTLVVADAYTDHFCAYEKENSGKPTQNRLNFFHSFGKPALVHENHRNAPEGGTFTFVAYETDAILVDWTLCPQKSAERPKDALILFDHGNIPIQNDSRKKGQDQRLEEASERLTFFCMMAAVTIKYIAGQDGVFVNTWLENLTRMVAEVQAILKGETILYHRGSYTRLSLTPQDQMVALLHLCQTMDEIGLQIDAISGNEYASPRKVIDRLVQIAEDELRRTVDNQPG